MGIEESRSELGNPMHLRGEVPPEVELPEAEESKPETERAIHEALNLVAEANDLNKLNSALSILQNVSKKDSELFKDSIFCSNIISSILHGTVHGDISFRYIWSQEIRKKLEELQLVYRLNISKNFDELKSIVREVGKIKDQDANKICENIDKVISLNGTSYAEVFIMGITNKFGLRDAVRRILKIMPKVEFKPEEVTPKEGPVEIGDENRIDEGDSHAMIGMEAPTKTAQGNNTEKRKSNWRRFFGM